jgi:RimJ/RimL family protein N-acetyltransferase
MVAFEHAFSDEVRQAWLNRMLERFRRTFRSLVGGTENIGRDGRREDLTRQDVSGREGWRSAISFSVKHWKQGFAIESARACMAYALYVHSKQVYSIVATTTFASLNVAIKTG